MKNRKFYIVDAKNVTKGYDFISDGYNSKFASKSAYVKYLIVMVYLKKHK